MTPIASTSRLLLPLFASALALHAPRPALGHESRPPAPPVAPAPSARAFALPMLFAPNQGQMRNDVAFAGWRGGISSYFKSRSFAVRFEEQVPQALGELRNRGLALEYTFENALPSARIVGEDPQEARFNFFKGNDPAAWRDDVPTYSQVRYDDLYAGIDVVMHDVGGTFVYDVVAEPGADLDAVRIRCDGVDSLEIDADGSLVAQTPFGKLVQQQPRTWQTAADGSRIAVDSRFVLLDSHTYGFESPDLDPELATLVDPGLSYSTYLGGSNYEHGCGVDVDHLCALYVTGGTLSFDFPVSLGAFDTTFNLDVDVFVTKIDATGEHMIYSTFLGGGGGDYGHGIRVDDRLTAYLSGGTSSSNYPVTAGAFDTTHNGQDDVFVTRLDAAGKALVYSTFVGGSNADGALGGQSVVIDDLGNAFIVGYTGSANFPTTAGAFDGSFNGLLDVFALKLSADGSTMFWSTLVGGTDSDIANVVDIDDQGNAFIGGLAVSNDYPTSAGAYASIPNGTSNGIITKVDSTGASIAFSSFTGGSYEVVRGIAVENGQCFAAGYTLSSTFPTTPGSVDTSPNGGSDGFLVRFSLDGTGVVYASYLGGTGNDVINDVDTDNLGHAYFSGSTDSIDFPTTAEAFDASYNGGGDTFCTRVAANGATIDYSTYVGGSSTDTTYALNVHTVGAFYMVGSTFSTDFPTTKNALDKTHNGSEDIFIVQVAAGPTACTNPAQNTTYGTGKADSLGNVPSLSVNMLPTVPAYNLMMNLSNAKGGAPVIILVGTKTASYPFDGGTVLVEPKFAVSIGNTDPMGQLGITTTIVDNANFCGDEITLQAIVIDNALATAHHASLSNGVMLTFGN